jgi:peptide chain release factor
MTTWLQVSAGYGPEECTWVVARLVAEILAQAEAAGVLAECVEAVAGSNQGTLRSALIEVADDEAFADQWPGSVLWVGTSPYRPHHRRRNWFVQVVRVDRRTRWRRRRWRDDELEISMMRSGGAGGQNVNKRSTAVRVRHKPSGVEVVARNERTQIANRGPRWPACLDPAQRAEARRGAQQQAQWDAKGRIERGNPRRVFRGPAFSESRAE